jgi:hypothetical protein
LRSPIIVRVEPNVVYVEDWPEIFVSLLFCSNHQIRESLDHLPGNLSSIFCFPIFEHFRNVALSTSEITTRRFALRLFEIALVLVRLDHAASGILNRFPLLRVAWRE